jgi:8-oxo-dGTP pyrophosphatase MutT (NUDIX family)
MKYRRAVFIVVYNKKNDKIEYLILKRKLHWKGWEFPKGGIEQKEKLKSAIKREAYEETGLRAIDKSIKRFDFSGKYDYNRVLSDRPGFKGQTFHLYSAEVKKGRGKLSYEHSRSKWVAFETALKMLKWPNQKKALRIVNRWLKEKVKKG